MATLMAALLATLTLALVGVAGVVTIRPRSAPATGGPAHQCAHDDGRRAVVGRARGRRRSPTIDPCRSRVVTDIGCWRRLRHKRQCGAYKSPTTQHRSRSQRQAMRCNIGIA